MERRIQLTEGILCRVTWWESTHEATSSGGILCRVVTACSQETYVGEIRQTRSEEPPTCLRCVAATATTTT